MFVARPAIGGVKELGGDLATIKFKMLNPNRLRHPAIKKKRLRENEPLQLGARKNSEAPALRKVVIQRFGPPAGIPALHLALHGLAYGHAQARLCVGDYGVFVREKKNAGFAHPTVIPSCDGFAKLIGC